LNPEYNKQFAEYAKCQQAGVVQPSIVNLFKKDYTPEEYKEKVESVDASQE
jgi:hypothetical protein